MASVATFWVVGHRVRACRSMSASGEPVLQTSHSRHDPYGCDDKQGRAMFERLGGTQIVRADGHFDTGDQQHESFELLDQLIDCGQTERAGRPSAAVWPSLQD
jgi:hypothetical protein